MLFGDPREQLRDLNATNLQAEILRDAVGGDAPSSRFLVWVKTFGIIILGVSFLGGFVWWLIMQ